MHWSSEGIVLGARRHGESSVVLELMTREHGRHLGLVHGGRSSRLQAVVQAGNTVQAVWRARLDEYLGTYTVEPVTLRSGRLMASPMALYGLAAVAAHLRLLPERDPHEALFETTTVLVEHLDDPELAPALFVRFEVALLAEIGFGLDLHRCAVTGGTADLSHVSPRTGRAVTEAAGHLYRERLLPLPGFLAAGEGRRAPGVEALRQGFGLTEHFLRRHAYQPGGTPFPDERSRFAGLAIAAAERAG